jgi:hypothetical protein
MAVTVTLELTDAQWALVLEHYAYSVADDPITTTEELAAALIKEIERTVIKRRDKKVRKESQNTFNV